MLINDTSPQVVVNVTVETPCDAIKSIQRGQCQKRRGLLSVASKGTLICRDDFSRYYKRVPKKQQL